MAARKKIALVVAPFVAAAALCLGLGVSGLSASADRFAAGRAATATVTGLDVVSRFNGRQGEEVKLVRLDVEGHGPADVVVGYHAGLSVGQRVRVAVTADQPPEVVLDAGFLNGPPVAVFLTLFGVFWAVVAAGLGLLLLRLVPPEGTVVDPRIEALKEAMRSAETASRRDPPTDGR